MNIREAEPADFPLHNEQIVFFLFLFYFFNRLTQGPYIGPLEEPLAPCPVQVALC